MTIINSAEQAANLVTTPMMWINKYMHEQITEILGLDMPAFFPTSPTTLDDLTQSFPQGGVACVYDRMGRMRRTSFPHIKGEEAIYYFYATAENSIENMIRIQELVMRLMDREDETAEEINKWMRGKTISGVPPLFYFHRFKVYQLQETRDIIDFGTARTIAGNKFIIDFEYHRMPDITNA
jgi:seryl-tRNA synthetase